MNQLLQIAGEHLPLGSLDAYIQRVNLIPLLSAEEEQMLARRFRDDSDLESARQLVLAHLRYVVRVARGYMGYGLPLGDLIQEGNIGLMKAVKRFDPEMGVRLVSFAIHWIKAEIHEFVLRNWRIVKVATTKAQRKLFFNLRQMKNRLGSWMTRQEVQDVADDLGVSPEDVLLMEQRLSGMDSSFDAAPGEDDNVAYLAPASFLNDEKADPALIIEEEQSGTQGRDALAVAFEQLDKRSQEILQQRWLVDDENKATLHELAAQYGVSAERVRQLEKNAMKKLRQLMEVA